MGKMDVLELVKELEKIGNFWANGVGDMVNNKDGLSLMIIENDTLDIDEITDFNTSAMSIGFRIIKRGGRLSRDSGSRTGRVKSSLWVEFNFRKFTDGGTFVQVEVTF